MTTGARIKERRKELGISADALAVKIGVSRSTVFRYESGFIEKIPSSVLATISKALKVTHPYLLGWTDDPESHMVDFNSDGIRNTLGNPDDREFAHQMLEIAKKNEREVPALNEKEKALNTLLNEHGLNFQKYTTKGILTDYGFVGREGGVSFTADRFNRLLDAVEDSILRIYVRFANEGEPEWLQQRRNKQYGLSDTEE